MKRYVLYLSLGLLVFSVMLVVNLNRNIPRVVFCDVGQGDGIYIRTPNGSDLIIDTGPNRRIIDCLARHMPYFDSDIETIIITHHDRDHDGGLPYIKDRYTVREVLDNTSLKANDRMVTENLELLVLHPKNVLSNSKNNDGLILLLQSGSHKVLFLADVDVYITEPVVKEYARLLPFIDVLKVSHHGSRYGTSTTLLRNLRPTLAIISAGKKNWYGHPHAETVRKLTQLGIAVIEISKTGDYEYPL